MNEIKIKLKEHVDISNGWLWGNFDTVHRRSTTAALPAHHRLAAWSTWLRNDERAEEQPSGKPIDVGVICKRGTTDEDVTGNSALPLTD